MPKIALVTDTDASLPAPLAAHYAIQQVPITVHFGAEVLESNRDIDDTGLFERIDRTKTLPTTAAPAPGKFAAAYQAALDAGADQVICFTVSSAVSAAYAAAVAAKDTMPGAPVTVVDSRTLTLAQGYMVLAAAEAIAAGATATEAIACAENRRDRTHLFAALATLKYLAMSGRVGHLAAGMAGLLNIKPVLTIRDGKLDILEKVRTRSASWNRLIELAAQALGAGTVERMGVIHVAAPQEAQSFEAQLRASLPCPAEILQAGLTPGLSVHSGAGLVGVVFVVGR